MIRNLNSLIRGMLIANTLSNVLILKVFFCHYLLNGCKITRLAHQRYSQTTVCIVFYVYNFVTKSALMIHTNQCFSFICMLETQPLLSF